MGSLPFLRRVGQRRPAGPRGSRPRKKVALGRVTLSFRMSISPHPSLASRRPGNEAGASCSESVEGQAAPPRSDALTVRMGQERSRVAARRAASACCSGAVGGYHWITFVQAARWFAIVLLLLGILMPALRAPSSEAGGVSGVLPHRSLAWGFGLFVLVGLAGVGWFFLEWHARVYLPSTTRRFIEAGGIINKWSRDTSLSMITDMLVGHPWIGRILGYGEIDLLTAARGRQCSARSGSCPKRTNSRNPCSTPSISSRSTSAAGTPPAMPPRRRLRRLPLRSARRPTTSTRRSPGSPTCATAVWSTPEETSRRREEGAPGPALSACATVGGLEAARSALEAVRRGSR